LRLSTSLIAAGAATALSALVAASPVLAQSGQGSAGGAENLPAGAATSDQPSAEPEAQPSIQSSLGPYGDPGGFRADLQGRGITYSFTYIGETFGVASGGQRRGGIYEGRLDGQLDLDLDKLLGWKGATFHTNFYQIHGHGLSRYYLGNLFTTSSIEALSSTRLFELWVEQKLLDDKLAIRVGQLAADTEFITSQYGGLFVNATYGWPAITGSNLPSGGPAYPLATPGARVKWQATDQLTLMGAIFNGDPAGNGPGDPQINNPSGTEFRLRDPAFLIGEAAYSYNQGKDDSGLPGTIKLGAWHHLGRFDHQRFAAPTPDAPALLLADPSSSGVARRLRGNSGIYAVFDQLLYREAGSKDQGLGMFARVSASPNDRNLISFYADGGLTYKGLFPNRPDDTMGVSVAYARISSAARGFDADTAFFNPDTFNPIRSSEAMLEVTYQAQIVPGWTVQPDFQYIRRPGANVLNPRSPSPEVVKDAAIVGLRTTIRY
jgi:porin